MCSCEDGVRFLIGVMVYLHGWVAPKVIIVVCDGMSAKVASFKRESNNHLDATTKRRKKGK